MRIEQELEKMGFTLPTPKPVAAYVPAVRSGAVRPVWPGCPAITGRVATIAMEATQSAADNPLPDLVRALAGMAGAVVVIDLGERIDLQCWGGVLTVVAQRFGLIGAVVNGAVRDLEALADSRFPVYARGVYPGRVRGRLRMIEAGGEVALGDGRVSPSQMVVADSGGVLFLPAADTARVVAVGRQRALQERWQLARVRAGEEPSAVFGTM